MSDDQIRLKYLAEVPITNGLGLSGAFDEHSWPRYVRTTDIYDERTLRDDVFASQPPDVARTAMLQPGDVLMTAAGTIGKSYLHTNDLPSCYAGYLERFRANSLTDPRYISYWTQSAPYWSQIEAGAVRSTIDNFSAGRYRQLLLPSFPLTTQRRIADFLDDQVARIGGALDYQRLESALLEERRRGIILSAVRGNKVIEVRRDVGPVWLRTLPDSWPLVPVTSQFEVRLGKMLNEERSSGPFLKPYLRNTNVQWDRIDIDEVKVMDFHPHESARYRLRSGDLLICEGGQPGRSAIWDGEVDETYYQKALHRARSRGPSLARWFFYLLRAAVAEGAFGDGSGTTIAHLTAEQLVALRLPFPDPTVQASLCVQLDGEMQVIDQLAGGLSSKRELLEERKRALITAAVTGEFDVSTAGPRAAAAVTG